MGDTEAGEFGELHGAFLSWNKKWKKALDTGFGGRRLRATPRLGRVVIQTAQFETLFGENLVQANIASARMAFHTFEPRDARRYLPYRTAGAAVEALPGERLDEFTYRQAAGIACRTACRQDVVGPAAFVAIGHRGVLA
jgi:hypothetical protein